MIPDHQVKISIQELLNTKNSANRCAMTFTSEVVRPSERINKRTGKD
jgi:hypothetical protein